MWGGSCPPPKDRSSFGREEETDCSGGDEKKMKEDQYSAHNNFSKSQFEYNYHIISKNEMEVEAELNHD